MCERPLLSTFAFPLDCLLLQHFYCPSSFFLVEPFGLYLQLANKRLKLVVLTKTARCREKVIVLGTDIAPGLAMLLVVVSIFSFCC